MGWIIAIIGIILVIYLLLYVVAHYWFVILALATIGFVVYLIADARKVARQNRAAEAERAAAEADRLREHQLKRLNVLQQIASLGEQSLALFESMPRQLTDGEKALDQAEADFAEGAFAPFWDSIERAAVSLGRFDEAAHQISNNSTRYSELAKKFEGSPPKFPIARQSASRLAVGTTTSERMKAIVRKAQRNFQFATIYEHRKTNQILVKGFTNLGQALDQMTNRITSSIDDLGGQIEDMTSSFDGVASNLYDATSYSLEQSGDQYRDLLQHLSGQAAREKRALQMLDNIQRHRRPSLFLDAS